MSSWGALFLGEIAPDTFNLGRQVDFVPKKPQKIAKTWGKLRFFD